MPHIPFTQKLSPMLYVRSVEETYQYYTKVLGFLPGFTMPGPHGKWSHAEVNYGDVSIMFGRIDEIKDDPNMAKTPFGQTTTKGTIGGGICLYINLGNACVDQYYRLAKDRGANVIGEPQTQYWGDRTFMATDPDGYLMMFAQTVADFDPAKAPKG